MHDRQHVVGARAPASFQRVSIAAGCIIVPDTSGDGRFLSVALDPQVLLGSERGRRLDPLSQLALVAVDGARQRAGMGNTEGSDERSREGVVVGSALGATTTSVRYARRLVRAGVAATNPIDFPDSIDGAPAAHVAFDLGLGGPSLTFADGEESAAVALIQAARQIAWGRATRMYVVVGDKLDLLFGAALTQDPTFVQPASGQSCVAAECVFALVLERFDLHCTSERALEPAIEVVGFLDAPAHAGQRSSGGCAASDDWGAPPAWQLAVDGGLRLSGEAGSDLCQLIDPSSALRLAAAWLGILGPTKLYGGAFEPVGQAPIAERVHCGMPSHPQLGFVRVPRP